MLVPTMAFAWWVVSHPAGTALFLQTPFAVASPATPATDSPAPADESPAVARGLQAQEADEGAPLEKRVLVRSVLTPDMVRVAQTFLDLPLGAERAVGIDGHRYVFVLEPHYHPPGFVGAPNGWHKGVTMYELVSLR